MDLIERENLVLPLDLPPKEELKYMASAKEYFEVKEWIQTVFRLDELSKKKKPARIVKKQIELDKYNGLFKVCMDLVS
jgi:hypothetical protein